MPLSPSWHPSYPFARTPGISKTVTQSHAGGEANEGRMETDIQGHLKEIEANPVLLVVLVS